MNGMMPVTRALLIANVTLFLLQQFGGDEWLIYQFALWPIPHDTIFGYVGPQFHLWQIITYGFLHSGFSHLFFNMFALWMFGSQIETLLNSRRFAIYYFVCVAGAALTQLAVQEMSVGPMVPTVGASGGVFGLLLAFGLAWPRRKLMLLFPPIPMPAWLFVTLYGALELYLGVTGTQQGVAHFAHLGGMAAGFVLIIYWRRQSVAR
ncbi:MAG: rhomboid family intramembrane serine protease [Steroidobacteraceae bacterium]